MLAFGFVFSFPGIVDSAIHSTEKSQALWKIFQPVHWAIKQYKVRWKLLISPTTVYLF